jgi:hypothetical protein
MKQYIWMGGVVQAERGTHHVALAQAESSQCAWLQPPARLQCVWSANKSHHQRRCTAPMPNSIPCCVVHGCLPAILIMGWSALGHVLLPSATTTTSIWIWCRGTGKTWKLCHCGCSSLMRCSGCLDQWSIVSACLSLHMGPPRTLNTQQNCTRTRYILELQLLWARVEG